MLPEVVEIDSCEFEALFRTWARATHTARLEGGWDPAGMGRFSYLGVEPYRVVAFAGTAATLLEGSRARSIPGADPFALLAELFRPLQRRAVRDDLPFDFQGGGIGFLGYGLRRFCERVPARIPDDLGLPDLYMAFYDVIAVYDHLTERAYLVSNGLPFEGVEAARRAKARLDAVRRSLSKGEMKGAGGGPGAPETAHAHLGKAAAILSEKRSAFDRAGYG